MEDFNRHLDDWTYGPPDPAIAEQAKAHRADNLEKLVKVVSDLYDAEGDDVKAGAYKAEMDRLYGIKKTACDDLMAKAILMKKIESPKRGYYRPASEEED